MAGIRMELLLPLCMLMLVIFMSPCSVESYRVDCAKFVFAPRCRGVSAKRSPRVFAPTDARPRSFDPAILIGDYQIVENYPSYPKAVIPQKQEPHRRQRAAPPAMDGVNDVARGEKYRRDGNTDDWMFSEQFEKLRNDVIKNAHLGDTNRLSFKRLGYISKKPHQA